MGFEKLLNDETGLHVFTEFLKKEFSQENIQFWIACEKFKKLSDPDEVSFSTHEMFSSHTFVRSFVRSSDRLRIEQI